MVILCLSKVPEDLGLAAARTLLVGGGVGAVDQAPAGDNHVLTTDIEAWEDILERSSATVYLCVHLNVTKNYGPILM